MKTWRLLHGPKAVLDSQIVKLTLVWLSLKADFYLEFCDLKSGRRRATITGLYSAMAPRPGPKRVRENDYSNVGRAGRCAL